MPPMTTTATTPRTIQTIGDTGPSELARSTAGYAQILAADRCRACGCCEIWLKGRRCDDVVVGDLRDVERIARPSLEPLALAGEHVLQEIRGARADDRAGAVKEHRAHVAA